MGKEDWLPAKLREQRGNVELIHKYWWTKIEKSQKFIKRRQTYMNKQISRLQNFLTLTQLTKINYTHRFETSTRWITTRRNEDSRMSCFVWLSLLLHNQGSHHCPWNFSFHFSGRWFRWLDSKAIGNPDRRKTAYDSGRTSNLDHCCKGVWMEMCMCEKKRKNQILYITDWLTNEHSNTLISWDRITTYTTVRITL